MLERTIHLFRGTISAHQPVSCYYIEAGTCCVGANHYSFLFKKTMGQKHPSNHQQNSKALESSSAGVGNSSSSNGTSSKHHQHSIQTLASNFENSSSLPNISVSPPSSTQNESPSNNLTSKSNTEEILLKQKVN